ncbi:NAD(P)H-dependent oxidoreductase [Streptomyces sp. NPDC026672]|uniref:NADPH-dependent FMN reductase n=1 Tax=unclassified Streptomyces TaxID=2593676 RepID=UPI0033EC7CCA
MTRIVLISGSLRRDSLNTVAITTIRGILDAAPGPVECRVLPIDSLPHYDQDVDEEGREADVVRHARRVVENADALIVSTPSYNGSIPGVLKNALDWLSRPWGASALTGRTAAVLSASPGPRGAADALPGLRTVLRRAGALLVEGPDLSLGNAADIPTRDGSFVDPWTLARLETLTQALLTGLRSRPPGPQPCPGPESAADGTTAGGTESDGATARDDEPGTGSPSLLPAHS